MAQVLSGTVYDYVAKELINATGNYLEIGVFNGTDVHGVKQAYDEFKEKFADRVQKEQSAGGSTRVILIKESND